VLLDGETPYSWAIWYGKDEAAKLLAHKGGKFYSTNIELSFSDIDQGVFLEP